MQVLIFGAPGVGKGTQAQIIAEERGLKHISTGDIFRENIQNQTELGKIVKAIIDRGELVSDELTGQIVKDALSKAEGKFILDGYPRTIAQVEILEKIFNELNITSPKVVILDAKDEIIINRLTSRRLCRQCGNIISLLKVAENGNCPKCGATGDFEKRKDDEEEVIRKRLEIYHATTKPVVDHFRKGEGAIVIDGTMSKPDVTELINQKL